MEDSSSDLLGPIVDEYLALQRGGRAPDLDAFVPMYPGHEEKLRQLLPMADLLDTARPMLGEFDSDDDSIGAGSRLGDYSLVKVIGRVGMGVVYQAEHVLLGSVVAIKVLPRMLNSTKHRERFLREASAAALMNHPNIVRVFDFGAVASTNGLLIFDLQWNDAVAHKTSKSVGLYELTYSDDGTLLVGAGERRITKVCIRCWTRKFCVSNPTLHQSLEKRGQSCLKRPMDSKSEDWHRRVFNR
ncbi:Serine/threonine-protein kinase Pkn1 [Rubripirellula lacrimiformis]|uniref:Serine/threonine-protein kinase Pkn1 n=2 Tax=Rubripirellula lacrimiformis TaxID=1930273 RepID=A0A517NII3_9BACT|nr:Serine/threonine-protein kinase Pkn1 [Rubripirellula lacrimiformis]